MKRINNLDGFSLMEMMVVLLIVAVVMAASAPMISRRMIKASENSPWLWLAGGNIGYNIANKDVTAIIGDTTPNNSGARLYIKTKGEDKPQIALAYEGQEEYPLNISYLLKDKSLGITTKDLVETDTIAIGYDTSAEHGGAIVFGNQSSTNNIYDVIIGSHINSTEFIFNFNDPNDPYTNVKRAVVVGSANSAGEGATAVGPISYALGTRSVTMGIAARTNDEGESSVAIGENAIANTKQSIALGYNAKTQYSTSETVKTGESIAIGHGATVTGNNSIAIGADATVEGDNIIQLGNSSQYVYTQNEIQYTSDRKLKNVGDVYKGGLNELKKLEFFHYTYKKDTNKTPHVGVIAQDLQKVFPDAVVKGKDGFLRIRQEDMFYAVINAVKELDAKITALTQQVKSNLDLITKLQNKVTEQENQITELKKQNQEFEKRLAKLEKHSAK